MSYLFYKWLHLSSLFIMVLTTGMLLSSAFGASYAEKTRKTLAKLQGFALIAVLFAGFGLLAKGKIPGVYTSIWFWAKLAAWLLFGLLPILVRKTPDAHKTKLLLFYSLLLATIVYLVLNKPF